MGAGIGGTPHMVLSPMRAAGFPFIKTVEEPLIIAPPPLCEIAGHTNPSPCLAAGKPPISTLVLPETIRPECPARSLDCLAAILPISTQLIDLTLSGYH